MTRLEARTSGGLDEAGEGSSVWSRLLIPVLTAALVLVMGMVLVGLTGDEAESNPGLGSSVATPLR